MNNKGFGLQEVLLFIGCSMFALIVISIYFSHNFNDVNEKNIVINSKSNPTITPNESVIPNEYKKIEEKLKDAAIKYNFNKNESVIISLNKLKHSNIIKSIQDPNNKNISCNGYVIYKSDSKEYIPYLKCDGMYATSEYNSEFE